jgi:hypothetical protein
MLKIHIASLRRPIPRRAESIGPWLGNMVRDQLHKFLQRISGIGMALLIFYLMCSKHSCGYHPLRLHHLHISFDHQRTYIHPGRQYSPSWLSC